MSDLETPQHLEADIYYDIWSVIGQNNQRRFDDIKLENNLGTHGRGHRINLSIFGVSGVDTYKAAKESLVYKEAYHVLFYALN